MTRWIRRSLGLAVVLVFLLPGVASAAPANDNFAGRETIAALPFSDTTDTTTATLEGGEPESAEGDCVLNPPGYMDKTVWYQFTAPTEAILTADTFGSDFDTVIAVWTGTSLGSLTPVDCNDQFDGSQSEVSFPTSAGTTYLFQVGGYFGNSGTLIFHLVKSFDLKEVALKARPRKLESGQRTKLTAVASPCPEQAGDTVEFWRGDTKIGTKVTNASCTASKKVKVTKTSTFQAVAPVQDNDDLGGQSKKVKVRVT
jgi:hypothetical protein